jgi:ABC-type phosphate transport system substrate-binding protein
MKAGIVGIAGFATLSASAAWSKTVVVVNPANAAALGEEEIKGIFLGKRSRFPDGTRAQPVDQSDAQPARKEFYAKLAKMTETDFNAYWSALIFTGNAFPPKKLEGDLDVKNYVKANPGAIGYVDAEAVDESIKVIYTLK